MWPPLTCIGTYVGRTVGRILEVWLLRSREDRSGHLGAVGSLLSSPGVVLDICVETQCRGRAEEKAVRSRDRAAGVFRVCWIIKIIIIRKICIRGGRRRCWTVRLGFPVLFGVEDEEVGVKAVQG